MDKLQYQLQQSSKLQQQDRGSVGQQTEMDETRKDQDELVKVRDRLSGLDTNVSLLDIVLWTY